MFDEMERLAGHPPLLELLADYVERAAPDRQVWQDRRMELDGCSARDLSRLHGELIAYGWLEQNTGTLVASTTHPVPASYRVTPAGIRALKEVRAQLAEDGPVLLPMRRSEPAAAVTD